MGIYVYCPRRSTGAFELAAALGAVRLKRFDGMDFWTKKDRFSPEEGSAIVCWGTSLPALDGLRVLNSMDMPLDKFQQWELLVRSRIPSPRMTKPDGYHSVEAFRNSGYVARSNSHTGGLDLLTTLTKPDYYSLKETFTREFRIHSFAGRSIRAGNKIPREGFTTCSEENWKINSNLLHPWVRSYDGGWKISYEGFASTPAMRELAHKAVKALGLTFGAVDIAQRPDGTLVVLECNTAPGIEGNSLGTYVRAIQRWEKKDEVEGE